MSASANTIVGGGGDPEGVPPSEDLRAHDSPPSIRRARSFAALGLAVLGILAGVSARPLPPDATEILRRSEDVRSPDLEYAVDFTISVLDDYTPGKARTASYTMIAKGKARTMVLMLEPDQFYGGTLLIRDREYWLLLPRASRALQLSAESILRGDVSNGDLARANLVADYEARLDGEEKVEGASCWRIELSARAGGASYPRIRGWIEKKSFFPRKYEYYGHTGSLLRTARYADYRRTPLGMRSMRMDVESPGDMNRRTTMTFRELRRVVASPIDFSPEGMVPFRDAALATQAGGRPARAEDLLVPPAPPARAPERAKRPPEPERTSKPPSERAETSTAKP